MKVPFYGHVKQYHAIKAEIDSNIQRVLESGQYVMGPMLERFEQELADYHGMKYAVAWQWNGCLVAHIPGPRNRPWR